MNIQYYGDYCFKITTKPLGRATDDIVIIIDPCEKNTGLRAPQGQRDIVLLTHSAASSQDIESKETFDCPGEFDIKGVAIFGYPSFRDKEEGSLRGKNTFFTLQTEDIVLCHLGALGHELSSESIEKIGHVDILFVPIGNRDTLGVQQIDDLMRKLEPAIVIPMHYEIPGLVADVDGKNLFCSEAGNCPESTVPKLTLKKKDLDGKNMEIVFLEKV